MQQMYLKMSRRLRNDPLYELRNVIMAPHCIAWTHDLFREIGHKVCTQVVEIANGKIPEDIVNKDVLAKRNS